MKLGKKPARHGAVKLAFESYFDASQFPTPPLVFGKTSLIPDWRMLANDRLSNCVFAGAAHETMLWNAEAGNPVTFEDYEVITDYAAVTGYDPGNPDSDQGTDMQEAAAFRQKVGVRDHAGRRHPVDSYVSLRPGHIDELTLAVYLLGAVGVGIQFPSFAMDAFDRAEPWDAPAEKSDIDGGHYIPIVGRNSHGNFICVTWGRLQAITPRFLERYMDEGIAYLSHEMLRDDKSRRGFDVATLKADLAKLGHKRA